MNKKGMFFTILAVVILMVLVLGYSIYYIEKDNFSAEKRVDTMSNFVFSIEKDLSRKIFISGFRGIFLAEKRISDTGNPISNMSLIFQELVYNGTFYGEAQEVMNGATIRDIESSIQDSARTINILVNITPIDITITQDDPWHVKITLYARLLIQDKGNVALWNKTEAITAYVPIENFEDPLYIIYAKGFSNKIIKTNFSFFAAGSDVSNLISEEENSYYISSTLSPSFLDRLEGKVSSNQYGIESLVNAPKLSAQGIPIKGISSVDYIYLTNNPANSHLISGMPSWFRLDDNHLAVYNVSGLQL